MPDGDGWTVDDNVRSDSGRILLWNSVRRVVRDRLGCVRNNGSQGRGPSTYEVEGPLGSAAPAAQSLSPLLSSPTSRTALSIPIARSARQSDPSVREAVRSLSQPVQRNTPTSIRQVWATHRSTRCLPPRKAPFPGATRQGGGPLANPRTARPLARTPGSDFRWTPRFPSSSRSPSLVAWKISTAAKRGAQGAGEIDFKILRSSTGDVGLPPCGGMLSTGCPPVRPHAAPRSRTG